MVFPKTGNRGLQGVLNIYAIGQELKKRTY